MYPSMGGHCRDGSGLTLLGRLGTWVAETGEGGSPLGGNGGGNCCTTDGWLCESRELSMDSNLETANSSCSIRLVFSASVYIQC